MVQFNYAKTFFNKGDKCMKKVRWGVLGTANIARGQVIPGMQLANNCELYAIAGQSLEKARLFQEEFGFQKAYGSYEELLSDPNVEAVYIPLPNQLHLEWTCKALQAGKHVLCEKPLAPTVAQIEKMIATAKENGVFLMEAFAYLHSPLIHAVKAELDSGAIGQPLYMESAFVTSGYSLSNIRMRKETCGGAAYDLGCYNTSLILWMFGEEPTGVQAAAEFSPEGIDLCTTGLLTFPGGKRAVFQCAMVLATDADKRLDRFQIHGTKGCIRSEVEFNQCGELSYTVRTDDGEVTKTVTTPHNYQLEVEQLGRCILDGESPYVSHDFTLKNARVLEQVLSSLGYTLPDGI